MHRSHIVSFGRRRENLQQTIDVCVIGSNFATVQKYIKKGSTLYLHCQGKLWGQAEAASDYFFATDEIWTDKVYPHRFRICKIKLLAEPVSLSDGIINRKFRELFGIGWAYKFIFSPRPLPPEIDRLIRASLNNAYKN